jgi:hypothetical protein
MSSTAQREQRFTMEGMRPSLHQPWSAALASCSCGCLPFQIQVGIADESAPAQFPLSGLAVAPITVKDVQRARTGRRPVWVVRITALGCSHQFVTSSNRGSRAAHPVNTLSDTCHAGVVMSVQDDAWSRGPVWAHACGLVASGGIARWSHACGLVADGECLGLFVVVT